VNEIRHSNEAIAAVAGAPTIPAFRPPFNDWNSAVVQGAAAEGYDVYLWDVDSGGYRRGYPAEAALTTVLANARAGSIVLMHPNAPADNAALGAVIDGLRERGLEPCRISDLVYASEGQ
jgi:peptidoglycan/xylan/chitin deacetylase (PgdA/CDA1 family)